MDLDDATGTGHREIRERQHLTLWKISNASELQQKLAGWFVGERQGSQCRIDFYGSSQTGKTLSQMKPKE
jgi:hypothetical protein